jgi:AcrR family transcriptional regulator
MRSTPTTAPDLRTRVLDAADRLLARYGYRKMTVEDIASEAGIGKGSVYLAFASKEEVALSCIDRMVEALLAELRSIAAGKGTPLERLRAMLVLRVTRRVDYAHAHAASLDALRAAVRPAFLMRRARHFAAEAALFAELLEAARAAGAARAIEPAAAARALVTATNALLPYSLSVAELGRRAEIEHRADAVAELLVLGIAAPAPSPTVVHPTRSHPGGSHATAPSAVRARPRRRAPGRRRGPGPAA